MSVRHFLAALLPLLPAIVWAEEFTSEFAYTCHPKQSYARLSVINAESRQRLREAQARGWIAEIIDIGPLIKRSDVSTVQGSLLRTGSSSLTRICGEFTLTVSGGYLNANPDGAEGLYELPVISISHQGGKRFATLTLGTCDATFSRFSLTTACPQQWATDISTLSPESKDGSEPTLSLEHQYADQR
ncbi:MAG TPA: hypothetical protein VK195_08085 [Burkholderiaceae bacterium]|nr:hypothetical protein [Burkholderiaceae bacterium]